MDRETSSYYPPRATGRWISPRLGQALDRGWLGVRRTFIRSPLGRELFLSLSGAEFLLCCLVPGRGYSVFGHRQLGRLFLAGWAFCGLVALVFMHRELLLGWAVGGMASCHASGVGFLLLRQVEEADGYPPRLRTRVMVPLISWFFYAALVYWPGFELFRNVIASPFHITTENRTVIINPRTKPAEVRRGDLIAFNSPGFTVRRDGQVPVNAAAGPMLGRVLGMPGDRVEFTPTSVRINGRSSLREPTMPVEGSLVVEPGTWMVWPSVSLRINNAGNMDTASVTSAFLTIARVSQGEFVGRAYDRWFFRRQDAR